MTESARVLRFLSRLAAMDPEAALDVAEKEMRGFEPDEREVIRQHLEAIVMEAAIVEGLTPEERKDREDFLRRRTPR